MFSPQFQFFVFVSLKIRSTKIECLHFKALQLIVRDYWQRRSRESITDLTKHLPPDKWQKFVRASLFLNMFNAEKYQTLIESITSNLYGKSSPGGLALSLVLTTLTSKYIGRQETQNWIGTAIGSINHTWTDRNLPKDSIRILLKKTLSYKME